ncbi:hypothetical protein Tco_0798365 [Tanacetum coccineum]
MHPDHQISKHNSKWTKDHPLENIIGKLARPVSTRLQLHEQALFCYYDAFLTSVEPKTYKDALTQSYWIEAMQEELNEFKRLKSGYSHVGESKLAADNEGKDVDLFTKFFFLLCSVYKKHLTCGSRAIILVSKWNHQSGTMVSEGFFQIALTYLHMRIYVVVKLTDYGLGFNKIPMYSDNKSAIALSCNNVQNIQYQLANIFTKALAKERIEFLINKLGMQSFTPETLKQLADEVDEYWIMDNTRAQQKALDDELVALVDRLKIGILKSKEPTLQVALDALKLTPFYNAFAIFADVPEIYMQEFWVTVSIHHSLLCFKLNGKKPPLKEEILSIIRDLGHTGEIKFLSDVNVNHMHQPWKSFAAIINKCLSGKTTALESLHLSRAQILRGMYHNKTVDYMYLMWEDLVYQVENKNSKKNNDMDDFMFTTIRVISKHQDTQTPKPKSTKKKADSESSPKTKLTQASKGKRIKTVAKGDKPAKKKQSVTKSKGLTVLSEVALTEAEQIKLATKRSLIQTHSSHASGSGADEGTGSIPGVPDVPTYKSDDEQISWKSSEEEDDDEVNVSKDNDDDADNDDDVDKDDEDDDVDNQDDEIQMMQINDDDDEQN